MAIESRLVSKTIENAQSRVEGYNFDIRKRVVEYDDVINKQRETIYAERDKVLHNEDLGDDRRWASSRARSTLLVDAAPRARSMDDWDIDGLAHAVAQLGIDGERHRRGGARRARHDQRARSMERGHWRPRRRTLDGARSGATARETWAMVERLVLLRAIDQLWVDHLTELDDFRRGVGLRGYGGTDPLVEFKREAFKLYEELRGFIRHQVAATIFRVNVQVQRSSRPQHDADADADPPAARRSPRAAAATRQRTADRRPRRRCALQRAGTATSDAERHRAPSGPGRSSAACAPRDRARPASRRRAAPPRATGSGPRARPRRAAPADELQRGDRRSASRRVPRRAAAEPAERAKLGRNDPCCCGSGKKYKSATASTCEPAPSAPSGEPVGPRRQPQKPDAYPATSSTNVRTSRPTMKAPRSVGRSARPPGSRAGRPPSGASAAARDSPRRRSGPARARRPRYGRYSFRVTLGLRWRAVPAMVPTAGVSVVRLGWLPAWRCLVRRRSTGPSPGRAGSPTRTARRPTPLGGCGRWPRR